MGMPYRMSGIFSAFFVLSHSFPKAWYKEKAFQQQRKYLFAVFMAEEGIHMAYFGLELAFVHCDIGGEYFHETEMTLELLEIATQIVNL